MALRRSVIRLGALFVLSIGLAILSACGASPAPTRPTPPPVTPPANALPVIDSITVQGSRAKEPANFADAAEGVTVTAKVHDDETPVDQLLYAWTATAGTFTGTGTAVTWVAPATVPSPATVTITLNVTEKYGTGNAFEHSVESSATLSLHDSVGEVATMSRQFLLDFSDSNIRDVPYIMRNFAKGRCPQPEEVDSEYSDVTLNRQERRITDSSVGASGTSINFGGACPFRSKRGDACAVVPVFWADVVLATGKTSTTRGNDIVAASYSSQDQRWWLCASDYQGLSTIGTPFHFSR